MTFFAWLTAILFTIGWLPQMHKTWCTKSTHDLEIRTFLLPCVASVSGMIYTAHIQDWVLFGGYFVGALCTSLLVYMCLKYRS